MKKQLTWLDQDWGQNHVFPKHQIILNKIVFSEDKMCRSYTTGQTGSIKCNI